MVFSALHYCYRIFLIPSSARINTNVKDLDERVAATVRIWLEAMATRTA
ncbi:MAG: hypothetical protein GY946_06275 [bacterium]|nr:hypothetical protein [bacterium]